MGLFRNTSPKNKGRARRAQEELNWTIDKANDQYKEAVQVDGIQLNYWKRTEEGLFCTCGYGHSHIDNQNTVASSGIPNSKNFNTGPDDLPTKIVDSRVQPQPAITVRGLWDDEKLNNRLSNTVLGVDATNGINHQNDIDNTITGKSTNSNNDSTTYEQSDETEAFFSAPPDYDLLSGMEKTQCGICLGTGKTQAWNLVAGKREVFNSQNVADLKGFFINKDSRPYSFDGSIDTNNYVEWVYVLPTYFLSCMNYSIRNNTKAVRDLKLFYKIQGSSDDFQRLTLDFINSRQGQETVLILRVQPIVYSFEGLLSFTHFEIVWQLSDFPSGQMGNLSVSTNQQIKDIVVSTSFTLTATIPAVTKNDLIYDSKYNRMWSVSDYTDFMTSDRKILGWTVSARGLQQYEQKSLLMVSANRYYETSYKGLKSLQSQLLQDFQTI